MFLLLGDFFRLISGKLQHKWLHFVLQVGLAFFARAGGIPGALMIYTPFVLLILYRYFVGMIRKKKLCLKEEFGYLVCISILWSVNYFTTYLPWSVRTSPNISRHGVWSRFFQMVLPTMPEDMDTVYILRKSDMEQIDSDIWREMEAEILECFETENYLVYALGKNFSSVQ